MRLFKPIFWKHRRRSRWAVRMVVVTLALSLGALPWIGERVARGLLAGRGVEISRAEVGYEGLRWEGLDWAIPGWQVNVDSVEVASWKALLGVAETATEPAIAVSGVRVVAIGEREDPASADPPPTPPEVFAQVVSSLGLLERWLPQTVIREVRVERDPGSVRIGEVSWRAGRAVARDIVWGGARFAQWMERLPNLPEVALEHWSGGHLRLGMRDGEGRRIWAVADVLASRPAVEVRAGGEWADGQIESTLAWGSDTWVPTEAVLRAEARALPPEVAVDLAAWAPNLQAEFTWDGAAGTLAGSVEGTGTVAVGGERVPWSASLQAAGDASSLEVEALAVDLPGIAATLDESLRLDLATLRPEQAVRLQWSIRAEAMPWYEGTGAADGFLSLRPDDSLAGAVFSLEGTGRDWVLPIGGKEFAEGVSDLSFETSGTLGPGSIAVDAFAVEVGAVAELSGSFEWDRRSGLVAPWKLRGHVAETGLAPWLPAFLALGDEGVEFSAEGAQTEAGWDHSGHLEAPGLKLKDQWPAAVSFSWKGHQAELEQWDLELRRAQVGLTASGLLGPSEDGWVLAVDRLAESRESGEAWSLGTPARLQWGRTADGAPGAWSLSPVELTRAGDGRIRVEGRWSGWADAGIQLKIEALTRADADPWLEATVLPEVSATLVEVDMHSQPRAENGYSWVGTAHFDATWVSSRGRAWTAGGGWTLEERRARFADFRLETGQTTWLRLEGEAPVGLRGGAEGIGFLAVDETAPLSLLAVLEPVERLPQPLEARLPFAVQSPRMRLEASGTLSAPAAHLELSAEQLNWRGTEARNPIEIRDFLLNMEIAEDAIELEGLSLRLAETRVPQTLTGSIGNIDWAAWLEDPRWERWLELSARLEVRKWPVAALGRLLPPQLDTVGTVTIALEKAPGDWPDGHLRIEGVNSRPLAAGLVVRDISGVARIEGKRLEDVSLVGTIGGQPWTLAGWVDADDLEDPLFRVSLEAERLDLIRRADLMLRARAQLEAVHEDPDTRPRLQGDVTMQRSLWLQGLQDFTRQGAAGVARRPPFFSVDQALFGDWELDVRISGDEFLQIRTTVLTGEASAECELGGTLGRPLLTGEAWVTNGALLFPFARLPADALRARITAEAPHTIRLSGTGEGAAYGYLIQYQLSGTAEEPALTFSSVPSLPADEILLMVATGAVPTAELSENATERAGRLALYIGQDFFSELMGREGASRIEFRTGDGFSPFRREGQVIEYELDEDWSILGEYDDFGGYNVDLKWRLLQR